MRTLRPHYVKGQPLRFARGHQGRGKKWSPEARVKHCAAMRGRVVSEEIRRKLSETHKRLGTRPPDWAFGKGSRGKSRELSATWKGGVTMLNGYRMVYLPTHARASPNGYVYEHILVAEQMLGRPIVRPEVVHHRDGDKANNAPENLQVFPSQSEHLRAHHEMGHFD